MLADVEAVDRHKAETAIALMDRVCAMTWKLIGRSAKLSSVAASPGARLRFPHPSSAASPWQSRTRTMAMQEPAAMQVDPTETSHPEILEELRTWVAIDTAERHQPV